MEWLQRITDSCDSILRAVMGMKPRIDVIRAKDRKAYQPSRPKMPELVKSRPAHLEQRYAVQEDGRRVDKAFGVIRDSLIDMTEEVSASARRGGRGKIVFREAGKTAEGRRYAFFKPMSDFGWLMERTGAGWRISRAEKIVDRDFFLRSNAEPWDVAVLYEDPSGEGQPRVKSLRFGTNLIALEVYQDKLRGAFETQLVGG